jgi:NAD(P)-dependent dehydrogenase (short-subunit alcohol dehydrogenase family)
MSHNASSTTVSKRSILITGCSSGIGLHAATRLQSLGWQVLATCRGAGCGELQASGASVLHLDLETSLSVISAVSQAALLQDGRRLDAIFLNAGFAIAGAIEDLPTQAWQTQFQVNLFSQVDLVNRLITAGMLGVGSRIVWCGSVLGIVAMPMRGAYSASKAAMEAVADVQRLELAHKGIAVSVIQPGPILTRFRANSLEALHQWVDLQSTDYAAAYDATIARLSKAGAASPGTLGPEAVTEALLRCLEARRPAPRYRVTRNTKVIAVLRRVLPHTWLEAVVRRASGQELLQAMDLRERARGRLHRGTPPEGPPTSPA